MATADKELAKAYAKSLAKSYAKKKAMHWAITTVGWPSILLALGIGLIILLIGTMLVFAAMLPFAMLVPESAVDIADGTGMAGLNIDLTKQYYDGPRGRFYTPVSGTITDAYGWRIHPVWGTRRFHTGIDIAAGAGTPVRSALNGVVIFTGNVKAYGKTVVIDHGGIQTRYAHLSRILVDIGDEVSGGHTIGEVGNTGISTGPHLHFEIWKAHGGILRHVNPLEYMGR
ncbi:MAG: M23 family metallopeptidase [Peptococcaceae bacterium]|nr:M23 family metallopeptidase [Peptococcaceae bacterium]